MNKRIACLLALGALLLLSSAAARADQFSDIQNCPFTYWVPTQTPGTAYSPYYTPSYYPPPGYAAGPPPPYYYYGPPPYAYGPRVYYGGPRVFIGFHFH